MFWLNDNKSNKKVLQWYVNILKKKIYDINYKNGMTYELRLTFCGINNK